MKKFLLTISIFVLSLIFPTLALAQGMMESQSDDGHTAQEEAEGKKIWGELQDGELKCEDLTDENFGALGEYFMGQMSGDSHEAMNNMMMQMMGEEGEEEMHVAMGKRMSNCEPNISALNNSNNPMSMMNFGFASFGWVFMILFWVLVIAGIVALIKWIAGQNKTESKNDKSALDILKERYAKGEINKKEFEEKKKDLK